MARGKVKRIDLGFNLARIEEERAASDAQLAEITRERAALVLDGTPEAILDADRRQSLALAAIEQADARIVAIRQSMAEETAAAAIAARLERYEAAKVTRADGVAALVNLNAHLSGAAIARTQLIKAKAAIGDVNRDLPPGLPPLSDPEGECAFGTSILDKVRLPLQLGMAH